MSTKPCLTCGQYIGGHARGAIVKGLATRLTRPAHFPKVYSLLNQLPLCAACLSQIPFLHDPWCRVCGRHMTIRAGTGEAICGDCTAYTERLQITNRSAIHYDNWAKNLIGLYKYRGDERLMQLFSALLLIAWYRHYAGQQIDLITYVPLHEHRLRERGFNQTQLLADIVGRQLGLPVQELLVRHKNTAKLSQQTGKQSRLLSMNEAFLPVDHHADLIAARNKRKPSPLHVLLIDDIYTTGATIRSCSTALWSIPAFHQAEILSLTICRS